MFELIAPYKPAGDQPQAIAKLTDGRLAGAKHQVLLAVTGSGKTFMVVPQSRDHLEGESSSPWRRLPALGFPLRRPRGWDSFQVL